MRTVADRAARIPGLGPSTRRAIDRFTETGAADGGDSDTNGAPMRALPVGWAVPLADETRRREWTLALSRPTHGGRAAQTAACAMSACAAWAVEGATPDLLAEIAADEAAAVGPDTAVATALDEVRRGVWTPPAAGIGLDPAETVAAVLHCCVESGGDLDAALRLAVSLGGDTDTVAALAGGLLGSRLRPDDVRQRLGFLGRVSLPADDETARLAAGLAGIRVAGDD
jgi:ADP-ribosylglycohydrolase